MAENKNHVFVVATANDISALPPELVRKGRFDEIFFVDLPTPSIRASILAIHLSSRDQPLSRFDIDGLANSMEGFSGAEIEQAVVAALYRTVEVGAEVPPALYRAVAEVLSYVYRLRGKL